MSDDDARRSDPDGSSPEDPVQHGSAPGDRADSGQRPGEHPRVKRSGASRSTMKGLVLVLVFAALLYAAITIGISVTGQVAEA